MDTREIVYTLGQYLGDESASQADAILESMDEREAVDLARLGKVLSEFGSVLTGEAKARVLAAKQSVEGKGVQLQYRKGSNTRKPSYIVDTDAVKEMFDRQDYPELYQAKKPSKPSVAVKVLSVMEEHNG